VLKQFGQDANRHHNLTDPDEVARSKSRLEGLVQGNSWISAHHEGANNHASKQSRDGASRGERECKRYRKGKK